MRFVTLVSFFNFASLFRRWGIINYGYRNTDQLQEVSQGDQRRQFSLINPRVSRVQKTEEDLHLVNRDVRKM